jgi:hypothetical protein
MGSHHYWEIPPDMMKRVILGARCATDPALVHNSIRFAKRECSLRGSVAVKKAVEMSLATLSNLRTFRNRKELVPDVQHFARLRGGV